MELPELTDYAPLAAFALTLLTLIGLLESRFARLAPDQPNQRSLHNVSVPRSGGLAILCGIFAGWAVLSYGPLPGLAILAGLLGIISFLDDLYDLPATWRLLAHSAVATGFAAWFLWPGGYLTALVAILGVVWMINLYNFMDGSDGLAGGMACFGFGFYGLAAWLAGDTQFALANWSIAGAACAFLLFNFHPARIFMGDVGSVPLGFLAAALGITGWKSGYWPVWFPLMVFSPFIADASVTLLKRMLRGDKVWQAHREHYYQRLVQMGWGHRKTALLEYGLMAGCGIVALIALRQAAGFQVGVLLAGAGTYCLLMLIIDRKWANYMKRPQ